MFCVANCIRGCVRFAVPLVARFCGFAPIAAMPLKESRENALTRSGTQSIADGNRPSDWVARDTATWLQHYDERVRKTLTL